MPGMLRKSTAFVPRYQWFESISLQRRVVRTPVRASHETSAWSSFPHRGGPVKSRNIAKSRGSGLRQSSAANVTGAAGSADARGARRYPLAPEWLWQHGAAGPVCQASLEPAPLGWCNSCYRSIRSSILERTILDIQYPTASGIYRRNNRSITNRDYALSCSELAG